MAGQILAPGQMGVPMGITMHGFLDDKTVAVESLRARFALAALHALLSRETSTLLSAAVLGRQAVAAADAALAALAVPVVAPASSAVPDSGA